MLIGELQLEYRSDEPVPRHVYTGPQTHLSHRASEHVTHECLPTYLTKHFINAH